MSLLGGKSDKKNKFVLLHYVNAFDLTFLPIQKTHTPPTPDFLLTLIP